MNKSNASKALFISALNIGIILFFISTPIFASTITILPNGTIYTQKTPQVLGEVTSPQIESIQAKMKAEGDALLARFNAGEITYEQLKAEKAKIIEKYKAEIQAAKQPLIEKNKKEAEQTKTQIPNNAEKIEIKPVQDNKVKVESAPTEKTVSKTIAEGDEVIFVKKNNSDSQKETTTKIISKDQNKYMITNGVIAKVNTPISINLETNEMTITTPAGSKVVSILPDEAVKKSGFAAILNMNQLTDSNNAVTQFEENENSEIDTQAAEKITLTNYKNSPTYIISGTTKKKVFGLFPVYLDKQVYVSAVSGNIVNTETSGINQLLDRISF